MFRENFCFSPLVVQHLIVDLRGMCCFLHISPHFSAIFFEQADLFLMVPICLSLKLDRGHFILDIAFLIPNEKMGGIIMSEDRGVLPRLGIIQCGHFLSCLIQEVPSGGFNVIESILIEDLSSRRGFNCNCFRFLLVLVGYH